MIRDRRGLTLLELLVALALLGVLLALAVPRVSAIVPGALLDRAARSLAVDLRFARVKAIAENRRRRVIVELDQRIYRIEADAEGTFVPVAAPRTLPAGVAFDASASSRVSDGRISIAFQPRGHTADNSTIVLDAGTGVSRRVIVSTAGRVRIDG